MSLWVLLWPLLVSSPCSWCYCISRKWHNVWLRGGERLHRSRTYVFCFQTNDQLLDWDCFVSPFGIQTEQYMNLFDVWSDVLTIFFFLVCMENVWELHRNVFSGGHQFNFLNTFCVFMIVWFSAGESLQWNSEI